MKACGTDEESECVPAFRRKLEPAEIAEVERSTPRPDRSHGRTAECLIDRPELFRRIGWTKNNRPHQVDPPSSSGWGIELFLPVYDNECPAITTGIATGKEGHDC